MNQQEKPTPTPTLRRLPLYLHLLKNFQQEGIQHISTTRIAEELQLDPTQVRKDIQYTGIIGTPKIGFQLGKLTAAIEAFLGWNKQTPGILIGVGNLGRAILGYERFPQVGISFVAAFDNDNSIIGKIIRGVHVYPLEEMERVVTQKQVYMGVLTVPAHAAQSTAEHLIACGIHGIWNFSPAILKVPESIIVENADIVTSLAVLSRKLEEHNLGLL
jgi:redox-sensing transcriptional repressor